MPRHYVICYDIGDHRRLARVHRTLAAQAMALQYSVFLFQGSATALQDCLQQLEGLLDLSLDDVRAYPLPARGLRLLLGRRLLPEGVLWSGLPTLDGMPHRPAQWMTAQVSQSPSCKSSITSSLGSGSERRG